MGTEYRESLRKGGDSLEKLYWCFASSLVEGTQNVALLKNGGSFSGMVSVSNEAFVLTVLIAYEDIWRSEVKKLEPPTNPYVLKKGWKKEGIQL